MLDSEFWLRVCGLVVVVILSLVIIDTTNNYYKDYNEKVVRLIEGGNSPLEINCAFHDKNGTSPTCLELAKKN